MKTVKFYTVGCKVNQYETQAIREQFQRAGFQESDDGAQASVCVINTCTVTHRADSSSAYFIRRAGRENPEAKIVVTGCLAQLDADTINNLPGVSLIVKNKDKNRIVSLLDGLSENRTPKTENQFAITYFKDHSRAFLKIQDGCNYRCSYCKVCLVRGRSFSRKPREVKQEAANLIKNGYLEIVLSGICLGFYGRDLVPELSLPGLIHELQGLGGRFRIRLSSIEVNDITQELIDVMAKSNRICRHLHVPVQSGDERILSRMNRTYSPGQYVKIVESVKRHLPDIAITTDVMVGFPGETRANFQNTIELIKRIKPSRVHIFPYSKRANTPAYYFEGAVPSAEIRSRMAVLHRLTCDLSLAYSQRFISKPRAVLIEKEVSGYPGQWEGYTDNYIKVRVKSDLNLKNQIIQARLRKISQGFVLAQVD